MPIIQEAEVRTQSGANFTAVHAGPLSSLDNFKLEVPALKKSVSGKLFIKDVIGLSAMEISMNKFAPGQSSPFYHKHKANEEAYIFVKGRGQMQIDGETIDVEEGSIVRVSTAGSRCIRNNSNEELCYICIQAKEGSLEAYTREDGVRTEDPVTWPE